MTVTRATLSVLIVTDPDAETSDDAIAISGALADAGHLVLGVRAGDASLPEAMARLKPDVVVVRSDSAVRDVLEHIVMATRDARRPIVMFTNDHDSRTAREAVAAGVSAYIVAGLHPERIRPILDVALARFEQDQALRRELADTRNELNELSTALQDRKVIDRAKTLLMQRQQLSEDVAYAKLRKTAMDKNLKIVEVAQRMLDVADLLG